MASLLRRKLDWKLQTNFKIAAGRTMMAINGILEDLIGEEINMRKRLYGTELATLI